MTYGLQVWDSAGNLSFDSTLAVGGVCLGFFTVATGGSTFSFPDFTSSTGVAISSIGGDLSTWYTTDSVPGYLRFIFPYQAAGATLALFAR